MHLASYMYREFVHECNVTSVNYLYKFLYLNKIKVSFDICGECISMSSVNNSFILVENMDI